jgi:phosphoribosylaminoimidazole-succinocarboxamide synthase
MMQAAVPGLELVHRGKVRDTFSFDGALVIVATDRISAFDVVMANGIPDKGRVLTQMSNYWFERLGGVVRHHIVSNTDRVLEWSIPGWVPELAGRTVLVKRAAPLPIECVARGYVTGSLYKEYKAHGSGVHGLDLPSGLLDGSQLPEPIFTPATKAQVGHDENISEAAAADLVGQEVYDLVKKLTIELYRQAAEHAAAAGLILADTKFEFGLDDDGLLWIDEALTPDSSRYWEAAQWEPGRPQPSFDKQYLRDWLEASGWDKRPPGPELPDDVVENTRARYLEACRRITGRLEL